MKYLCVVEPWTKRLCQSSYQAFALSLTASVRVFEGQLAHQKKLGGLIVVIMHELNNAD